jgi:hypothetical protein
LNDLRTELTAQCEADKKVTEDISHEYQNRLSDLDKRLIALKRVSKPKCLPIASKATAGRNAATGGVNAGQDVVDSADLLDYAGEAEHYRLQLISCQAFIGKVIK